MAVIAVLDEFHQRFSPGRSGNDPGDLMADAVGSLAGIALAFIYEQFFRGRPPSHAPRRD